MQLNVKLFIGKREQVAFIIHCQHVHSIYYISSKLFFSFSMNSFITQLEFAKGKYYTEGNIRK